MGLRWDLFCRVIDNFGDLGVSWRLAADLAARGQRVRLWTDDATPLRWMAPAGAADIEVIDWHDPRVPEPGDVVIEMFGCDPPPAFAELMAARCTPPYWINLEHLSAEAYVERCHGLPSPQRNGLVKRFFFPGFTPSTGGLLREPGLLEVRAAFDGAAWLGGRGWSPGDGERVVTLFCYEGAPVAALLAWLADAPTLLLPSPGPAQALLRSKALPVGVRTVEVPWLSQADYDRLLWSADLNVVRGEDSIVRAIWAGAPFVWQLYPQHDGVHEAKLEAFAARFGHERSPGLRELWRRWNGFGTGPLVGPSWPDWIQATRAFRDRLAAQTDLTSALLRFVGLAG